MKGCFNNKTTSEILKKWTTLSEAVDSFLEIYPGKLSEDDG